MAGHDGTARVTAQQEGAEVEAVHVEQLAVVVHAFGDLVGGDDAACPTAGRTGLAGGHADGDADASQTCNGMPSSCVKLPTPLVVRSGPVASAPHVDSSAGFLYLLVDRSSIPASLLSPTWPYAVAPTVSRKSETFSLRLRTWWMPGTTTNAADGTVTFDQLPFDAAGTYEYTLVQVAGNADGVTYDSTEYAATITVTATADNTLTAAVSYAKDGETVDAATFANVYKAPTKPGEPTQPAEPVS